MPSFLVTLVPVPSLVTVLLTAQHHMAAHCLSPSAHSCTPHCGSALASRFPYISNPTFPSASSGNDSQGNVRTSRGNHPHLRLHIGGVSVHTCPPLPLLLPLTVSPVRQTARVSPGLCVGPLLGTSLSGYFCSFPKSLTCPSRAF